MQIFVNLPVKDLQKTKEFFSNLGFAFNQQFTDETAACMIIDEKIFAMLLTREKFQQFIPKAVSDATKVTEVLLALSFDSREKVDEIVSQAVSAGGTTYNQPQDHGFMYQHGFQDLDGHIWEIFWMDPEAVENSNQ
ncbi:MAG: extradiol dioxygenase [Chloroflexi bacterium RBG_16_54_18]|nr:MAG: extradiol dioxygenase [Chloroflexi bacterium RBG_16_54_18]